MYGDDEKGYALGIVKHGVFIPTHFAPRTLRGGQKLFQKLGDSPLPTVLFISEDLANMLKRMPEWKVVENIEIPSTFRGDTVKKRIAHNDFPDFQEKLMLLAQDYFNSHDTTEDNQQ